MKLAREIARTALPIFFILGLIVALVIGVAALTGGFNQLPILLRLGFIGGVIGGLVLLAVQIAGVVKRFGARSRLEALPLVDLQRPPAVPESRSKDPSFSAETIFGNDVQPWFETLLERTFKDPDATAGDFQILTSRWAGLLRGLMMFEKVNWTWDGRNQDRSAVFFGPALGDLTASLRWLQRIARRQAELAAAAPGGPPMAAWPASLFAYTILPRGPAKGVAAGDLISSHCHPYALAAEISRLVGR